jgi:hypothetical protein
VERSMAIKGGFIGLGTNVLSVLHGAIKAHFHWGHGADRAT